MASKKGENRVRIGCDPEVFLLDATTGKPVPATGRVGGEKGKPIPINSLFQKSKSKYPLSDAYGVLEDGVCLEFNTPSFSEWGEFQMALDTTLYALNQWAGEKGLSLELGTPERSFDEKVFEEYNSLRHLGCAPDFDAYSNANSRKPFSHRDFGTTRYSGGHIHLGYDTSLVPPYIMARFMDIIVGLPMVMLGDLQKGRRKFYGQAGLYRPKSYGVEYRTPSNLWLKNLNSRSAGYMFAQVLALGRIAESQITLLKAATAPGALPWEDVQRAINTEDRKLSTDILLYTHAQFPELVGTLMAGIDNIGWPMWNQELAEKDKKAGVKPGGKAKKPLLDGDLDAPIRLGGGLRLNGAVTQVAVPVPVEAYYNPPDEDLDPVDYDEGDEEEEDNS